MLCVVLSKDVGEFVDISDINVVDDSFSILSVVDEVRVGGSNTVLITNKHIRSL